MKCKHCQSVSKRHCEELEIVSFVKTYLQGMHLEFMHMCKYVGVLRTCRHIFIIIRTARIITDAVLPRVETASLIKFELEVSELLQKQRKLKFH